MSCRAWVGGVVKCVTETKTSMVFICALHANSACTHAVCQVYKKTFPPFGHNNCTAWMPSADISIFSQETTAHAPHTVGFKGVPSPGVSRFVPAQIEVSFHASLHGPVVSVYARVWMFGALAQVCILSPGMWLRGLAVSLCGVDPCLFVCGHARRYRTCFKVLFC